MRAFLILNRAVRRQYSIVVNLNDKKFQNYLNILKSEYDEINKTARSTDVGLNTDRIQFLQKIVDFRISLEECQKSLKDLEDLMSSTNMFRKKKRIKNIF